MSEPILFGIPQSTYVRSARMMLEEKGVAYTLEPSDPRDPAHRERHPFGKVPAFQHGDTRLFETLAIASYVNDAFPGPDLLPSDALRRARVLQWVSVTIDYVYPAVIRRYFFEYIFPSDGQPDRARIDAALPDVRHHLGVLDGAAGNGAYLSGDTIALDDLLLAPIVFYLGTLPEGPALMGACPNLGAWYERVASRPSFTATQPPPPPA